MENLALDLLHQSDLAGIRCGGEGVYGFIVNCAGGFEEFERGDFVECGEFGDVEDCFCEHFFVG